ncbi:MAG: hypothetical protein OEV76_05075 [Anaerolineae bacterium]|nr:hypothetical protein [Anaerolineae bacterium]
MAVCEAVELGRKVAVGPLTGMTYLEVAQDTMDFLAFGQNDAGPPRGGWGYEANQGWADNSNSGYIQNDVNGDPEDGGSGYQDPNNWVNTLKTGNLLQQMALYGDGPPTQRVKDALAYLERHWNDLNSDPGWRGWGYPPNPAEYQATFTIMKGLTALNIPAVDGIDWGKDFETALVAQQQLDGSWPFTNWD